jgi:mRNA interferase MazF
VVILTRGSSLEFLGWVTVAPITSTIRGVKSEALLDLDDGMKGPCVVNAHNLTTVRREQIGRRVARLSEARLHQVCAAVAFALGCDAYGRMYPSRPGAVRLPNGCTLSHSPDRSGS